MKKFPKFTPNKTLTALLFLGVAFSVVTVVNALTPNPGHNLVDIGGGLAVGDIVYGSGIDTAATLAAAATGNALISGTTPSWGKIGLTTHVSGILPVASGGTATTSLIANNVVLGNGTSAPFFVAPGTSGNLLQSNGTTWTSVTPAAAGDMVLASVQTVTGNKTFNPGTLISAAGTAALAPQIFTAGTNLTTPLAGRIEYDGTAFFRTVDTTQGRTQDSNQSIFRLTANGAAIGPAIADYFGANSSIPTVTNGVYEITFYLRYLKTTAGTVTYTITNTQTYTNITADYVQSAVGGIATNAATTAAGIVTTTTAAAALPVTASLTTAVNHRAVIRAVAEVGTAGNIRLRVTSSAGTVTPLRGSYYTVRRLYAGNVGTFAP